MELDPEITHPLITNTPPLPASLVHAIQLLNLTAESFEAFRNSYGKRFTPEEVPNYVPRFKIVLPSIEDQVCHQEINRWQQNEGNLVCEAVADIGSKCGSSSSSKDSVHWVFKEALASQDENQSSSLSHSERSEEAAYSDVQMNTERDHWQSVYTFQESSSGEMIEQEIYGNLHGMNDAFRSFDLFEDHLFLTNGALISVMRQRQRRVNATYSYAARDGNDALVMIPGLVRLQFQGLEIGEKYDEISHIFIDLRETPSFRFDTVNHPKLQYEHRCELFQRTSQFSLDCYIRFDEASLVQNWPFNTLSPDDATISSEGFHRVFRSDIYEQTAPALYKHVGPSNVKVILSRHQPQEMLLGEADPYRPFASFKVFPNGRAITSLKVIDFGKPAGRFLLWCEKHRKALFAHELVDRLGSPVVDPDAYQEQALLANVQCSYLTRLFQTTSRAEQGSKHYLAAYVSENKHVLIFSLQGKAAGHQESDHAFNEMKLRLAEPAMPDPTPIENPRLAVQILARVPIELTREVTGMAAVQVDQDIKLSISYGYGPLEVKRIKILADINESSTDEEEKAEEVQVDVIDSHDLCSEQPHSYIAAHCSWQQHLMYVSAAEKQIRLVDHETEVQTIVARSRSMPAAVPFIRHLQLDAAEEYLYFAHFLAGIFRIKFNHSDEQVKEPVFLSTKRYHTKLKSMLLNLPLTQQIILYPNN